MLCIAPQPGVDQELERIQAVFGLPADVAPPRVTLHTLIHYREYLLNHLDFPFSALYAETTAPVRQLVRYITVLDLQEIGGLVSEGILCDVQGVPHVKRLALSDIGVREEDPNYQLVDDYAFWFHNWR